MEEIKLRQPIVITFNAGATINIGNFQSVRVTVGLSVPVYDAKKVDETYEKVVKKVERWLEKKIEDYSKNTATKITDEILVEEL